VPDFSVSLRADCDQCAALCCMALAFDRSSRFAIDKPAGEACPHLAAAGGCAIHETRAARGFPGCIAFDCLGAGPRVTQDLFGGRHWADDPTLIAPMSHAFGVLLRAHEQLSLLDQAARLDLSPDDRGQLLNLRDAIAEAGADGDKLAALKPVLAAFLQSLRGYVVRP
jgi:hypothetical protein